METLLTLRRQLRRGYITYDEFALELALCADALAESSIAERALVARRVTFGPSSSNVSPVFTTDRSGRLVEVAALFK